MNALDVISSEFPDKPLAESTTEHPLLYSRLTELQVHTLLGLDFDAHEVWTKAELRKHLRGLANTLNSTAAMIYPNYLTSEYGGYRHHQYIHVPKDGSR